MVVCEHRWSVSGLWAGGPVLIDCEAPLTLRCGVCGVEQPMRCGTTRSSRCQPCGLSHRRRVGLVAGSGVVVGVRGLFLTLTAPGGVEHFNHRGHRCPCTPRGGVDLAEWNSDASARWNRFVLDLSRVLDLDTVEQVEREDGSSYRRRVTGLVYFRATEVQRRGALHYHVMLRRRDGLPLAARVSVVRRLAIRHGFGHSVDVQRLEPGHAQYVAKYVSKASDQRKEVPWPLVREVRRTRELVNETTGEVTRRHEKVRAVQSRATYRPWSASRVWGQTMGAVRLDQQHYVQCLAALPCWSETPAAASWRALAVPVRPDGSPPD